jgi:hypothetical protein
VKLLIVTLLGASLASAESHPTWWTYASPDSTALVGIHWESLRQSPFADAIQGELSGPGSLGFPDLDCLRQTREMVLSSPPLLAAEAGKFSAATVQQQATSAGLHRAVYKGITMFLPSQTAAMGIAQMNDTLLLVGARKTLEGAVDRSLMEIGRRYTPLLMRAARYSQTGDLWVVSSQLPDPLASRFVPLDADAKSFEGSVSFRDGLNMEASFDAATDREAAKVAADLLTQAPSFPGIARGMRAVAEANRVTIELTVSPDQLNAELRAPQGATTVAVAIPVSEPVSPVPLAPKPAAAPLPKPAVVDLAKAAPPPPVPVPVAAVVPVPRPPDPKPAPEPVAPPKPQVIRIVGLDNGPLEIPYPPAQ